MEGSQARKKLRVLLRLQGGSGSEEGGHESLSLSQEVLSVSREVLEKGEERGRWRSGCRETRLWSG